MWGGYRTISIATINRRSWVMESFNNFTLLDAIDVMEDLKYARNKKLKKRARKVTPLS